MSDILGAGIGLKPQHYAEALDCPAGPIWFEVHPENYMVAGGPRLAWLDAIRQRHALSLHGVSLSLAADTSPDRLHLARLRELIDRTQPALVSEHLAWSTWRGNYYPDLLPFVRTTAALGRIADNIDCTQNALERRIAIENPSHYLHLAHTWSEIDFLTTLSQRTGCMLLVDLNNVHVSAHNLQFSAADYVDALPAQCIAELHLAGFSVDGDATTGLLIDSHDADIAPAVWTLYRRLIDRIGARPTLIERDGRVPKFASLLAECRQAQRILAAAEMVPA